MAFEYAWFTNISNDLVIVWLKKIFVYIESAFQNSVYYFILCT